MIQLILHWVGDYLLQSDWMALNKAKKSFPCLVHVTLYTLPFLLVTNHPLALLCIFATHFLIDRFAVAKYVGWIKNHLNPTFSYDPWERCNRTGYVDIEPAPGQPTYETRPLMLSLWLNIITDNGMHLVCNYVALRYL